MKNGKITPEEIRIELERMAEPSYRDFSSALIPDLRPGSMLGVRLPLLRAVAKQIVKGDWRGYLGAAQDDSFEEIMLQGMAIGYAEAGLEEKWAYVESFLPKIDNWSVCDSFCAGLKVAEQQPEKVWELVKPHLNDGREYVIRFAVVMILTYYVHEKYMREAFGLLEKISSHAYYADMAVAWAVSVYYLSFPKETLAWLEYSGLNQFTYNKALQKMQESKRVDRETKRYLKTLRRK